MSGVSGSSMGVEVEVVLVAQEPGGEGFRTLARSRSWGNDFWVVCFSGERRFLETAWEMDWEKGVALGGHA